MNNVRRAPSFLAILAASACAHVGDGPPEEVSVALAFEAGASCGQLPTEATPLDVAGADALGLANLVACRVEGPRPPLPKGWAWDGLFVAAQADPWVDAHANYFSGYLERLPACLPRSDGPAAPLFVFDSAFAGPSGDLVDATGHGAIVGSVAAKMACPEGARCDTDVVFELLLAGGSRLGGGPVLSSSHGTFLDFLVALGSRAGDLTNGTVANFSVGFVDDGGPGPRAIARAMQTLSGRGVQIVAAAGNRQGLPEEPDGALAPARLPGVLAVQALDPVGRPLSTQRDGLGPDVMGAPGFGVPVIRSSVAELPHIGQELRSILAGSSIASAVVAGLLARGVNVDTLRGDEAGSAFRACLAQTFRDFPLPSVSFAARNAVRLVKGPGPFRLGGRSSRLIPNLWVGEPSRFTPVGEGLLPQPLDPTCHVCQIELRDAQGALAFYVDPHPTPTPQPLAYWLRIVDDKGVEFIIDTTHQVQESLQRFEPVANSYAPVPIAVTTASLITVYPDPDPNVSTMYTFEEPVLIQQ